MEDSFRVRLDKTFGSLSSTTTPTPPSSSSLSSLWSLTNDEIERNEWIRDKHSPEPEPEPELDPFYSSYREKKKLMDYRTEMENDLEDLDDDFEDEDEQEPQSRALPSPKKPDDYNDEEWEIKSSIGLDSTLDYEEEEDEYDKVAVGLYMRDKNDYETDADSCNELPNSLKDFTRDPRANHIAAKIRLKEDAEAAKKIDSLRVSAKEAPVALNAQVNISEDRNLKSILKRKDNESDSKSQKRVRFDAECKNDCDEESEGAKDSPMEICSTEEALVSNDSYILPPDYPSGIPDYMRNPSKYTRYTFDSLDMDEESNQQAYMDFLKLLKRSNTMESQSDLDLSKSVTFVPKRKTNDATMVKNCSESKQNQDDTGKEPTHGRNLPIGIAAGDTKGDEVCAMEEDKPETIADKRNNLPKSGRRYRMKSRLESDELS